MKTRLLMDSSNVNLSLAIAQDKIIIYKVSYYAWQRQSEGMIPELEKALEETKLEVNSIDEVIVTLGPGSYTGVRIALTIAKVMTTANSNIKLKVISSLKAMGNKDEKYISLINARSNRSYIGIYNQGDEVLKDCVLENFKVLNLIEQYQKEGYVLKGELDYLNQSGPYDILNGLPSYADSIEIYQDVLNVKPIYLKDAI